jgi:hypothetical protein
VTELRVAALQMAMTDDVDANVTTAERLVSDAAAQGAQIILIPELFEGDRISARTSCPSTSTGRSRSTDIRPSLTSLASPPSSVSSCR